MERVTELNIHRVAHTSGTMLRAASKVTTQSLLSRSSLSRKHTLKQMFTVLCKVFRKETSNDSVAV